MPRCRSRAEPARQEQQTARHADGIMPRLACLKSPASVEHAGLAHPPGPDLLAHIGEWAERQSCDASSPTFADLFRRACRGYRIGQFTATIGAPPTLSTVRGDGREA